jgi:hypothetical protein
LVDMLTHQFDLTKAEFTHRAILHYAEFADHNPKQSARRVSRQAHRR